MPVPDLPQAEPDRTESTEEVSTEQRRETGNGQSIESGSDGMIESLIEERIESQTSELERELTELKKQVDEIDSFARISLNERKIKTSEANLSEFSDSLSGFAEKAFNNINDLEERLNLQALLLAAILDELSNEGIDLDLTEVERQQEDQLVMDRSPQERLEDAIERF